MTVTIFIVISCCLLFAVELQRRLQILSINSLRRLTHAGAAVINIAAPLYVGMLEIVLVNIVFALFLILFRGKTYLKTIQSTDRCSLGDVYFPLGIACAAAILLPTHLLAFQFGVAVMGFSDAAAGFIGERWGRCKVSIFANTKTVEGSLVFLFTTFCVASAFGLPITILLIGFAVLLTLVELVSVRGLDNLVLPVTAGLGYVLLVHNQVFF